MGVQRIKTVQRRPLLINGTKLQPTAAGGIGAGPQKVAVTTTAAIAGPVYTPTRLLGSTSTLALAAGTDSNLTMPVPSTGIIVATAGIADGAKQTAVVRESNGLLAIEYPVEITGRAVVVTPTPTPTPTPPDPAPTPTLGTLTLSTALTIATPTTGAILGALNGSTITTVDAPAGFTVNSANRTFSYNGSGSAGQFKLREALAGATNSPNDSYITLAAAGTITPPTLTRTSSATKNPMTLDIDLTDTSAHVWDDGISQSGTYDFVQVRRAASADYAGGVSDLVRLTPMLVAQLSDPTEAEAMASVLPNCLVNMPAGATRVSARLRRGAVPGRAVCMGDSITVNYYNWIYAYQQAHPNLEMLRQAYPGRGLYDYSDGNDVEAHLAEVAVLAPQWVFCHVGANQLFDCDPQVFCERLALIWQKIRALMPATRICWHTILGMDESQVGHPGHNAKRVIVNQFIRDSYANGLIDLVCDFAANLNIGTDAAPTDIAKFPDGLHPIDAQADLISTFAATADIAFAMPMLWQDSAWSNELTGTLDAAAQVAVTTWDPNKKSNNSTLQSGNRKVINAVNNNVPAAALSSSKRSTGNLYAEMTITDVAGSANFLMGVCNASYDPVTGNGLSGANATVYLREAGHYLKDKTGNDNDTGNYYFGTNVSLGIRVDFGASKVFFYVGGVVIGQAALPAGDIYIFAAPGMSGDFAILNTGQDAFTQQPAGTTMWG